LRSLSLDHRQSGNRTGHRLFRNQRWSALLLLVLAAQTASAVEVAIGVGGSVSSAPYKHYDTQWTPLPMIDVDSDYFYLRGAAAGVKIFKRDFIEVSVFGAYDATSFDSGDTSDEHLRNLKDRDASVAMGLEVRLLTPYGMLHASAARDILGNSEGINGSLGYAYSAEFGPLEIIPKAGVYWADSRYNRYYYGISDQESHLSGLLAYNPGAGVTPYFGLAMSYSLTDAWEVLLSGEMVFSGGNIQDSPMVGHAHTQSLTIGIMYNF